jgi:hypothetical protein
MEAVSSSETSVSIYQNTRRNNPEDRLFQIKINQHNVFDVCNLKQWQAVFVEKKVTSTWRNKMEMGG